MDRTTRLRRPGSSHFHLPFHILTQEPLPFASPSRGRHNPFIYYGLPHWPVSRQALRLRQCVLPDPECCCGCSWKRSCAGPRMVGLESPDSPGPVPTPVPGGRAFSFGRTGEGQGVELLVQGPWRVPIPSRIPGASDGGWGKAFSVGPAHPGKGDRAPEGKCNTFPPPRTDGFGLAWGVSPPSIGP
jgi:hypothetical protein